MRVIVLRGAGDRAFCAGADLAEVLGHTSLDESRRHFDGVARVMRAMERAPQPVIARVPGFALAGGCGLAVAADFTHRRGERRVRSARDRDRPAAADGVGADPAGGREPQGADRPRADGPPRARRRSACARPRHARRARRGARRAPSRSSRSSSPATRRSRSGSARKRSIPWRRWKTNAALTYLRDAIVLLSRSEDAREGITAFFEKRRPRWTGR